MKVIVKVFLALSVVAGVISGCATKSDVNDLKDRMDALESSRIQSIEGQISSIDTSIGILDQTDDQLDAYIKALKEQVLELEVTEGEEHDALNATIEALQARDEDLHKLIEELRSYSDTQLAGAKDWASATFATLDEYNKTAETVAGIKAQVESLSDKLAQFQDNTIEEATKVCTEAIAKAISEMESSMKSWVNEQLTGYYTVAQMDSKLEVLAQTLAAQKEELQELIEKNAEDIDKNKEAIAALESSIKTNTDDISALKSATEAQKEEITKAYKDYIAEAIKDGGVIGKAIQSKIDDVTEDIETLSASIKTCEDDIAAIKNDITDIKADIESLKTDIKNTLRNLTSISYIPAYSDHIERVEYEVIESYSIKNAEAKDLTLRFDVYPATSADSIAVAFGKDATILSARAVYTRTRANAGDFVSLKIKSATANEGVLSVVIPAPELGNEFILGKLSSSLILRVDTGTNLIQSEYIPLVPEAEGLDYTQYMVGSFDTSGDGSLDADEIAAVKSLDFRDLTDLSSLDLTGFTNLSEVICPSLDWLLGLNLSYNNTVTFCSPAGKKLISDHDVLIDGVIWQKYNVGATESNIEGDKFTFDDAQRACPSGYRTPTIDEYKSLVTNYEWKDEYSYMDGEHYGYLFCGSREYSSDAPAVFFPPMISLSGAAIASYWTCSKNTDNYSFYLYFEAEGRPDTTHAQKNSATFSVRCVKE